MPKMEHVGTEQQGKYTYTIFVEESGGHWEWEVNRIPAVKNEIVRAPAIAQGRAPSRDQAITTAQRACRTAMQENRNLDFEIAGR